MLIGLSEFRIPQDITAINVQGRAVSQRIPDAVHVVVESITEESLTLETRLQASYVFFTFAFGAGAVERRGKEVPWSVSSCVFVLVER